jgi:hypothetical protein
MRRLWWSYCSIRRQDTRLPCGLRIRHKNVRARLSLVERPVRDRKVAGSNPVAPTTFTKVSHPSPAGAERNIRINPGQKNGAFNKFED